MENPETRKTHRWTAEEIRKRLGISTLAFPRDSIVDERQIETIREAGIRRVEICGYRPPPHYDYRDRRQIEEIKDACRKHDVAVVAIHSPKVLYSSECEQERREAIDEAVLAATVAEELGASIFVAHFGFNSYSEKTVREILESLQGTSIKLTVENGQDLRDFIEFIDRIGSDRLGITVDIGHTRDEDGSNPFTKKDRARKTLAQCGPRLFHVHLHDFIDRDHYAPLTGDIQWDELFAAFADIDYEGEFMFEAARPSPEEVLEKTAAFPATFVERYCDQPEWV